MGEKKRKVTRIMRVTLDEDVFEKLDNGTLHSDKGLRDDDGRLGALPDIESLPDYEYHPYERDRTEPERERSAGETLMEAVIEAGVSAVFDLAYDYMFDSEFRGMINWRVKRRWEEKVKPFFSNKFRQIKTRGVPKSDESQNSTMQIADPGFEYEYEIVNDEQEKIAVSPEQAGRIIAELQDKARELSAMIFLLSKIVVKDDKTDSEYALEQAYIQQLVSDEAIATMRALKANPKLLDQGTALCISDYLDGYIQSRDQRIPVPLLISDEDTEHKKAIELENEA